VTSHARGISRYAGRSTRRYKASRARFRAECEREQRPCWLCGLPIDYTLVHPHPECFNLDHAYTVGDRPELAEDPANYRPSHKHCNEERGDNEPFIPLGSPSEDW